jgi:hypothetical protein
LKKVLIEKIKKSKKIKNKKIPKKIPGGMEHGWVEAFCILWHGGRERLFIHRCRNENHI